MKQRFDETQSFETGSKLESMTSEQRIENLNYILYMIAGLVVLVFLIGVTLHIKRENNKHAHRQFSHHPKNPYKEVSLLNDGGNGNTVESSHISKVRESIMNKRKRGIEKNDKGVGDEELGVRKNSRAIVNPLH